MFYPGNNGKGFLLVVTRVDDKAAYGYLLMPGDRVEPAASDALSASDDHMNSSSGAAR